MKKVFILMMLAFSVLMCSIQKEDKKNVGEETSALPSKIVIGLDDTFAPMGFKNEKGEIVGFDIDLAKEVAKRLNIEVEFKSINWDSKILDLNSGSIDLIWNGLTITPERTEETAMSKPYMSNNQSIVVRANSNIKTKSDLNGKIVGVQNQSSGEETVVKSGANKDFKEFKGYAQYDQAFMDLDSGRIEAIVVDEMFAKYIKNTKEDQSGKLLYTILEDNFGLEYFGIAAKKGNRKLIDAIDKTIEEMKSDGTYKEIFSRWFKD
ncbi:MAG: amino acid ABC transporter substrate-binding protein [Leptotrichiaceae bacterium]|nr:amino acid ABC transporter substrate-binding protein [Leptotrichiaceae bacterium]MBP6280836.1 amino acid ABC transporter substrate-binding protein [Leptotrichiaceae bacterium]MBP7100531.1 amino acid ABC transporter substrate-binding protein [Leptotrichiaceae bacterium]MBP7739336.1 amino acid ABC transporter substrate-binding protein [Leptotrichiaceae bacterium]MBP9629324.1 amino acid ABC transporter substrate-binding protein [Leptotrichiaceae bacterium]